MTLDQLNVSHSLLVVVDSDRKTVDAAAAGVGDGVGEMWLTEA